MKGLLCKCFCLGAECSFPIALSSLHRLTMKNMPKDSHIMDYTAEVFDQFQLLSDINGFNDHQLHCVLRFESGLDGEVLKKAAISSIEAISILGTRYIDGQGLAGQASIPMTSVGPSSSRGLRQSWRSSSYLAPI